MNKIEDKIKTMFQNNNENLRKQNIEREKKYFKNKTTNEYSFDDSFELLKEQIIYAGDENLSSYYNTLTQGFLFSKGHVNLYKSKLIVDKCETPLIENLFFPILKEEVNEELRNNPSLIEKSNSEKVIRIISNTLHNLNELQSIFLRLYIGEFTNGLDIDIKNSDLIKLMNKCNITVDKFLHSLVDEKCNIMVKIFERVQDDTLRTKYLEKIEKFRKQKHVEIDSFPMSPLPIQIFFHYTTSEIIDIIYNKYYKNINNYLVKDTEDIPKRKS